VTAADLPPPNSEPLTAKSAERFRVTATNYAVQSTEVLTTVRIVKPSDSDFIRVHPNPDMVMVTFTFPTKDGHVLIEPLIFDEIRVKVPDFGKITACVSLVPYITNKGALNLWPLKRESPFSIGGNSYNVSAFNVAARTRKEWLRISTDQDRGQYVGFKPEEIIPEPTWPKEIAEALAPTAAETVVVKAMVKLVELASKGGVIDSIDHPLIRPYRGLA
jgi:hypothetical protein